MCTCIGGVNNEHNRMNRIFGCKTTETTLARAKCNRKIRLPATKIGFIDLCCECMLLLLLLQEESVCVCAFCVSTTSSNAIRHMHYYISN